MDREATQGHVEIQKKTWKKHKWTFWVAKTNIAKTAEIKTNQLTNSPQLVHLEFTYTKLQKL